MTDKTIKERGLSTITLPAPAAFSFDETTRRQELVWYYQYGVTNSLITVIGEQSRTALIRKAFVHLGATGSTWDQAMRSWLQGVIPSAETNLYKLWLAYFAKYATLPDGGGITYAGLSVEAAYRKFLSDFIGGGSTIAPFSFNFTDPLLIHDNAVFKQRKIFADTVSITDAVSFMNHYLRSFSDSYSMSDAIAFAQKKFFADTVNITDAMVASLRKIFGDTVAITDAAAFVQHFARAFADTVVMSDAVRYRWIKVFADTVAITDAFTARLAKVFADTVTISDSMVLLVTYKQNPNDILDLADTALFRLLKSFADTVTMSDSAVFSFGGYNGGFYNDGAYNH